MPLRVITVHVLACRTETTMHGSQSRDAGIMDALQGSKPQVKVWIDGILDENDQFFMTMQHIGARVNPLR